jgi:hypothetical protein
MGAATSASIEYAAAEEPLHVTLLELVEAIGDVTDKESEVVATVMHMLRSGRVRLAGNFREAQINAFC